MVLRKFLLAFVFLTIVFKWDTGTAQEKAGAETQTFKSTVPILWTYSETLKVIDSLERANPITYWSHQNRFNMDFHEVSYSNWSAGGNNSVSLLFNIHIKRTYEKDNLRWQNEFITRYGISAEKGRKLRKTDDRLEVNSTFGYRSNSLSGWFYSAKVNFKTQLDRGYDYPNREHSISGFMAPGYLFTGIGAEYGKDSDKFTVYISPATAKTTYVMNQRLADKGDFGVDKAVYDVFGNLIRHGKKKKTAFGFLLTNEYNTEIVENVSFHNRLSLYTDYLNNFGNMDIDWKVDFIFKINNYMSARIGSHLLFDDETKIERKNADGEVVQGGAKIQWKQQLGIGFVLEI